MRASIRFFWLFRHVCFSGASRGLMRFLPHLDRLGWPKVSCTVVWEGFAKQLLLKNNMSWSQDAIFVFQSTGCHCFEMTTIHAVGGCGGGRLLLCRSSQSTKQFEGGSEAGDCEALKYTFLTPIKPFFQSSMTFGTHLLFRSVCLIQTVSGVGLLLCGQ